MTVQELHKGKHIPEFDHFVSDSLTSHSMIRSDPLPVPAHTPIIPSSLKSEPLPSHQLQAASSESHQPEFRVQPPTPTFHVESAKRIQSGSQPSRKKSRRADLLRVRQPSSNLTLVQMFVSLLSMLGESSAVYMDLHSSPNFAEHAGRLLDRFAASSQILFNGLAFLQVAIVIRVSDGNYHRSTNGRYPSHQFIEQIQ